MDEDPGPVRWLFVDLNSYFASVEQQLNRKLRGKPVGVLPIMADTSCCIAASYEAKACGVRTGTLAADARRMCPGIQLVQARPQVYVEYHRGIVDAVESCLPVAAILSVDEMACRLTHRQCELAEAVRIGKSVKAAIRERVGATLRCSVGLSTNRFLAKVACDMQKPDGLTVIRRPDLPGILYTLAPNDLPGIGPRMKKRLEDRGITTMPQVCALTRHEMKRIWGGIVGERFWYWLHGYDIPDITLHRSSVGHSHVLPPELRTEAGAYGVLQRLLTKAALRLRQNGLWTTRMAISVGGLHHRNWESAATFTQCRDTLTLLGILKGLWAGRTVRVTRQPFTAAVTLLGLIPDDMHNFSLFEDRRRLVLSDMIDSVNARYGRDALYVGAIHAVRDAAPTRIGFTSIPTACDGT